MKKTLVGLLLGVAALGAVTWLVTREEASPAPETLEIAGYGPEEPEAAGDRGMFAPEPSVPYPVDEVVLEREGERVHLVRRGEGDDAEWRLVEPVEAPARDFAVERIVRLFREPTVSIYSAPLPPEDLPLYDLEPERRIGLTLKADGEVWEGVDLLVGRVEESDSEAAERGTARDTWVARRGEEDRAWRIGGKDLRSPLEVEVGDLRDRSPLPVESEEGTR